jgi:methyl-accepting chemotaxis protein
MIIMCEKCEKKFRVDPERITGEQARFRCRNCGNIMIVSRPAPQEPEPSSAGVPEPGPATVRESQPPASPAFRLVSGGGERAEDATEEFPSAIASADADKLDEAAERMLAGIRREPETSAAQTESTTREPPAPREELSSTAPARRFGSMTPRIITLFLVAGLVPLVAFAAVMFFLTKTSLEAETARANADAAAVLARQLDDAVDANLRFLRAVAALPDMASMEPARQSAVLKAVSEHAPAMNFLFTAGPDGMSVSRSDDQPAESFEDRPYYREILAGKALAWQLAGSSTGRNPSLTLAVPVTRQGQVVGLLAGSVDVRTLSAPVLAYKRGKTGAAFLLDGNLKTITHPQKEYQADLSSHPLAGVLKSGGGSAVFALDGRGYAGNVRKTQLGWGVAVEQEEAEGLDLFRGLLLYGGIVMGCGVFLVLLISLSFARGLVRPLRALTDAAERMGVGDLEVEIPVRSGDEIGALAEAISRLQESIRLSIERLRRRR